MGPEKAANVRIPMKYSMGLYRAACKPFEKVGSCGSGLVEDKRRAEVCSYCNSFPLHLECLMVQMESWDTWKTVAVRSILDPLGYAGCRYLTAGLPASYHNIAPQWPILNVGREECLEILAFESQLELHYLPCLLMVSPYDLASLGLKAPILSYNSCIWGSLRTVPGG